VVAGVVSIVRLSSIISLLV